VRKAGAVKLFCIWTKPGVHSLIFNEKAGFDAFEELALELVYDDRVGNGR
jgi:hypothetical protein